ncbi:MAG: hypothetical protein U0I89_04995 [Prevotella sp.]|nr:hypothetical protein [Prevotella sp.]
MNKKTYSTPKTEVTRIEIQSFIAASDPTNVINSDQITADPSSEETVNGENVMSNFNINDVWE